MVALALVLERRPRTETARLARMVSFGSNTDFPKGNRAIPRNSGVFAAAPALQGGPALSAAAHDPDRAPPTPTSP